MMKKSEKTIYLINRFASSEITETESEELNQLISLGEVTSDELDDFQRIFTATKDIALPFFDSEVALQKVVSGKVNEKSKKKRLLYNLLKVAAIIIFGVFIGIAVSRYFLTEKDKFVEIETKKGDKIHIKLSEGNEVWLNSKSKIRYPANFTGTNRYIELIGEAYFSLQGKGYNPVIIKCNGTKIVGTLAQFNARTNPDLHNTQITVESGWISLTDPMWDNEQMVLEEGFKGTVDTQLPLLIEQNRNPNVLAWKTGRLIFDKAALLSVAETLSDVYDVNIQIKGEVKYCPFTNSYDNNNIDKILNDLKDQLNTSISRENNMIIINGNNCNI